ncbi:MAG TPA: hypothetical protein VGL03_07130 [Thermoanaerobaculia bacterium]
MTMRVPVLLLLLGALADPPATVPAQMRLKDGTVYQLRQAPHLTNGRFVFTTSDGGVYSLAEKEVDEIRLMGPTPVPRIAPNPHDSHELGAIARQERRRKGKHTLLAPAMAPTPRTRKQIP